jgi:broad specificity phosphatase PhoE
MVESTRMNIQQRPLCTFYITRHGETVWNTQKRMQGHQDSPLTENGISQAKQVGTLLKKVPFAHAFSSDLLRAKRTAEIICADHDLVVKTSQLLREAQLGPFEGKKLSYFQEQLRDAIAHRESLAQEEKMKYKIHQEIESYEESATRMITFLREMALAYAGESVLVVSHAGIIRSTLVKMGFASDEELPHGSIKNTGYAIVESDGLDFFVTETHGIDTVDRDE